MTKTILMPTDGSAAAEKALKVALDLASARNAQIKLLHVLLRDKEPEELLRLPMLPDSGELATALREVASGPCVPHTVEELMAAGNVPDHPVPEALLRDIGGIILEHATAIATEHEVEVDALPLADGAAAAAIGKMATDQAADMIVMGMRGLRPSVAFAFGSVSQEVCGSVSCTCITVH